MSGIRTYLFIYLFISVLDDGGINSLKFGCLNWVTLLRRSYIGTTLQECLQNDAELGLNLFLKILRKLINGLGQLILDWWSSLLSPSPPWLPMSLVGRNFAFLLPSRVIKKCVDVGGSPDHTQAMSNTPKRLQSTYK